jgi:hypothetical protein
VRSDGKQKVGYLILPNDHYSKGRWESIKEQGGEATESETKEIKEEIVTLQSTEHTAFLNNPEVSHYSDTEGNLTRSNADFERAVRWVKINLDADLTENSIHKGLQEGWLKPPPEAYEPFAVEDSDEGDGVFMSDASDFSEKARKEIESIATSIANKRASYSDDKVKWIRVKKEFYTNLKSACNVHPNIEISNVQNCVKLKAMLDRARRAANV